LARSHLARSPVHLARSPAYGLCRRLVRASSSMLAMAWGSMQCRGEARCPRMPLAVLVLKQQIGHVREDGSGSLGAGDGRGGGIGGGGAGDSP
jgi:hypothetical protein